MRYYHTNGLDELYDLKNDPGELTNLYRDSQYHEVRVRLQQRLDEGMKGDSRSDQAGQITQRRQIELPDHSERILDIFW